MLIFTALLKIISVGIFKLLPFHSIKLLTIKLKDYASVKLIFYFIDMCLNQKIIRFV